MSAGVRWDYGTWSGSASDFHAGNLLRDETLKAVFGATVASTGASVSPGNPERVANGTDDDHRLLADRLYTWTWENPV